MRFLIRTDASIEIGTGHVMRCLTIAEGLRDRGYEVTFMMKPLKGNLIDYVQDQGYEVVSELLPVEVLIIDHYRINIEWERSIRSVVNKIVVIDDLANREHDCDILLDPNIVNNFETRYDLLVPRHCLKLLGPKYLIMRKEFIEARMNVTVKNGDLQRLLIFMGGTDPTGETLKVLQALKSDSIFAHIDVVVGQGNPIKEKIKYMCMAENWEYHCQIDYIASLMAKADFSIGAGGSTTWERCYVGLPASSTIVAVNQIQATEKAESLGTIINLGWHEKVTIPTYYNLLVSLHDRKEELRLISQRALELTVTDKNPNPWIEHIIEVGQ